MGNTGRPPSVESALKANHPVGYMERSSGGPAPGGKRQYAYYKWNGQRWVRSNAREYQKFQNSGNDSTKSAATDDNNLTLSAGPLGDGKVDGKTKKWPNAAIESSTDYVFFQFGKYLPPFSNDANWKSGATFNKRAGYNAGVERLKVDDEFPTIMLPIPQDLGNEIAQTWQGKSFTGLGAAAITAMAGGNFSKLAQKSGDFTGNIKAIQDSLTTGVLNLIPGAGGNLDVNDISGATRGVVLNPNAELLYDAPEMREIGMSFKMVPKNSNEAKTIKEISQAFRRASLPSWGGTEGEDDIRGGCGSGDYKTASGLQRDNFIRVPRLCKFTFMHGGQPHEWVAQFKPCAISNVTVSYTPDGTFATYSDGSPVATELRLNFKETKLIFADEVKQGF